MSQSGQGQPSPDVGKSAARRPVRWPARLLLLGVSVALSLLLTEFAYRIFLFGGNAFSFRKINSVHEIGVSGLIQRSPFPEVAYELKPGLDTMFKLVPFRTNSAGLRDREIPVEKPPGVFRICVIGDSMTMPAGVAIEDAWHKVLERDLNARGSSPRIETVNFGVGGYYLRQYVAVLESKAARYQPDLVIVGFCSQNDHWIPPDRLFDGRYQPLPRTRPFFESFAWDTMRRIVRHFARKARGETTWIEEGTQKRDAGAPAAQDGAAAGGRVSVYSAEEETYIRTHFNRLAAYSRGAGVPVLIVNLYNQHNPAYAAELERLTKEAGLNYADASKPFEGTNSLRFRIYPMDNHPNAEGNRIFADAVKKALIEQNLVPSGATRQGGQ